MESSSSLRAEGSSLCDWFWGFIDWKKGNPDRKLLMSRWTLRGTLVNETSSKWCPAFSITTRWSSVCVCVWARQCMRAYIALPFSSLTFLVLLIRASNCVVTASDLGVKAFYTPACRQSQPKVMRSLRNCTYFTLGMSKSAHQKKQNTNKQDSWIFKTDPGSAYQRSFSIWIWRSRRQAGLGSVESAVIGLLARYKGLQRTREKQPWPFKGFFTIWKMSAGSVLDTLLTSEDIRAGNSHTLKWGIKDSRMELWNFHSGFPHSMESWGQFIP